MSSGSSVMSKSIEERQKKMFSSIWPANLRLQFQTEISGPALGLSSMYVTRDSLSIKLSPKEICRKEKKRTTCS